MSDRLIGGTGRNAWNSAKFRRVITKAGRIVTCSFGVVGLRDKKTGKMSATILFSDDDNEEFAFAFQFASKEEIFFLCKDLIELQQKIDSGNLDGFAKFDLDDKRGGKA